MKSIVFILAFLAVGSATATFPLPGQVRIDVDFTPSSALRINHTEYCVFGARLWLGSTSERFGAEEPVIHISSTSGFGDVFRAATLIRPFYKNIYILHETPRTLQFTYSTTNADGFRGEHTRVISKDNPFIPSYQAAEPVRLFATPE